MKCPACNEILFSVEYEEVEVDFCDGCQGIWLDANELDLLLGDHVLTTGFLSMGDSALAKREEKRLCPICDSVMNKLVTGGAKPIVHDNCPKGHGTWFDSGELSAVIEQGTENGANSDIAQWLRRLFPAALDVGPDT